MKFSIFLLLTLFLILAGKAGPIDSLFQSEESRGLDAPLESLWARAEERAESGNFEEATADLIQFISLRNQAYGLDSVANAQRLHEKENPKIDLRPRGGSSATGNSESPNPLLTYLPLIMFLGAIIALWLAWRYLQKMQKPD